MKTTFASVALVLALLLSGCGLSLSKTDETAGWSAQRLYNEAKTAMSDGNWSTAVGYFEKLEARYPFGRYAQQAQLDIAYSYYRQGEQASAVAACDRFIKLHPNHENVDYAYYLKGVVLFYEDENILQTVVAQDPSERDARAARDSFQAFKDLVQRYPDSKYAPDALARMKFLVNALASYEVHVADYYMRRGAYLAAANRAQYAVKTYPEAPAVEDALFIMVRSYDELGMQELRDDTQRIMQKNFPQSPYLSGGKVSKKRWWQIF